MMRKLPDDPEIEEMDPILKMWMFYNWMEDYADEYKLLENQGYLIGSFINPDAVRKIIGQDGQKHASTDEEFEATLRSIREHSQQKEQEKPAGRKKKKRKIME